MEKLKNLLDDPNMRLPFWEQFFPLFGDAEAIEINVSVLSALINEAAVAAENLILTQGGTMYSQYLQGSAGGGATESLVSNRLPPRRINIAPLAAGAVELKKYEPYVTKVMNYFVSAGANTVFKVKDVAMLYVYVSHIVKYKPLFDFLESVLFRKERECVPLLSTEISALVLDNLRELTGVTNIRLDYESLTHVYVALQRAVNNDLSKFPQVKVAMYSCTDDVYKTLTEPCKMMADKFASLLELPIEYRYESIANDCQFVSNPVLIENVALNIEKASSMDRMVFNAINNIFINTVEQCAAENIRFDAEDFDRRFKFVDRVRENSKKNFIEKVAIGDVAPRKRTTTTLSAGSEELKRYKSNKLLTS
ncbi:p40 [Hyphantria cunea granulovirus]|uniref:P40 n=1 Tax=Hyphantria cunea granulovirus TaxID=307448 RepID=A0AAF1D288_9BBAC|nr:p40 [Hyphantria cunea granulovirus]QBQ01627.1 p40 [Hyphantria cunea granulovirus]